MSGCAALAMQHTLLRNLNDLQNVIKVSIVPDKQPVPTAVRNESDAKIHEPKVREYLVCKGCKHCNGYCGHSHPRAL